MRKIVDPNEQPRELRLVAPINIEAVSGPDGQPPRPRRFHMDAYTGGTLAIAGWRFPVVVDLTLQRYKLGQ